MSMCFSSSLLLVELPRVILPAVLSAVQTELLPHELVQARQWPDSHQTGDTTTFSASSTIKLIRGDYNNTSHYYYKCTLREIGRQ